MFSQSPDTLCKAEVLAERHPVALSAAPLRVETRAAIERSGAKELSEVLRTLPGVSIKDYGGAGGIKTVSLRGFGSQHTQISYDGICISELQNGQVDISRFALDNLEAVSVTIGQGNEIFRSARSFAGAGILELRSASLAMVATMSPTVISPLEFWFKRAITRAKAVPIISWRS